MVSRRDGSITTAENPQPRERLTQAERVEQSDERMFTAAVELILERGPVATTLKDVGERAGFSRGLAGDRFGSKDVLFSQLTQRFNAYWTVRLNSHVGQRTGLAAFLASTEASEDIALIDADKTRAMYILWYDSIGTQNVLRDVHSQHHQTLRSDTERWITQAVADGEVRGDTDPKRFAVQYCSFLFGVYYQWLVEPHSVDLRQAFADYRSSALRLLSGAS